MLAKRYGNRGNRGNVALLSRRNTARCTKIDMANVVIDMANCCFCHF